MLMESLQETIDKDWLSFARLCKEFVFGDHKDSIASVVLDTAQAVFATGGGRPLLELSPLLHALHLGIHLP